MTYEQDHCRANCDYSYYLSNLKVRSTSPIQCRWATRRPRLSKFQNHMRFYQASRDDLVQYLPIIYQGYCRAIPPITVYYRTIDCF